MKPATSRALSVFIGLLLLLPAASRAQSFCARNPAACSGENCCGSDPPNGPSPTKTDPVVPTWGNSQERYVDLEIDGTLGQLYLFRTYSSSGADWNGSFLDVYTPKPFGADWATGALLQWWANWYSMIYAPPVESAWYVRTIQGLSLTFPACIADGGFCWADHWPNGAQQALPERLKWNATLKQFELLDLDGRRYIYGAGWMDPFGSNTPDSMFFLTQIISPLQAVEATFAYQEPDAGCQAQNLNADGGSTPGAGYMHSITTAEGNKLTFNYRLVPKVNTSGGLNSECVVSSITLHDRDGGAEIPVATLLYTDGGTHGTEVGGFLASGAFGNNSFGQPIRTEQYSYLPGLTQTYTPYGSTIATVISAHGYNANVPPQVVDAGSLWAHDFFSWAGVSGITSPDSCDNATYINTMYRGAAGAGDGTTLSPIYVQQMWVEGDSAGSFVTPDEFAETDICTGNPNSCSAGLVQWYYPCASRGVGVYYSGFIDKRGYWTDYLHDGGFSPLHYPEQRGLGLGATDESGYDALQTENYLYAYGPNNEQLLQDTYKTSVSSPTNNTETKNFYDVTTNRLNATIQRGWTQTFSGATFTTPAERYVGTFYLTQHTCSGLTDTDTLHRAVEVHGPCVVPTGTGAGQGFNAQDCPAGTTYPVTQYYYYSLPPPIGTDTSNNAGRLQRISRYPNPTVPTGCSSSTHLDTLYGPYDALGNPLQMTDPAGVVTSYTYEEDRVTSTTTGGQTWKLTYDNGMLTMYQNPQGNIEVLCWRTGVAPGASCAANQGVWTDRLQWKARFNSTLSAYSELVNYGPYWPDGTMNTLSYELGGNVVRRVEKYAADAQERPTWQHWGDAAGQFQKTRFFDGADNRAGIGLPYNVLNDNTQAFCKGPSGDGFTPLSHLCTAIAYDRANRASLVNEYPTSSGSAVQTCLQYDTQGNVSSISTGCSGQSPAGAGCSACAANSTYKYDDFGNVVSATLPWLTHGAGGASTVNYDYDALGNVIHSQDPDQASVSEYLTYSYDMLGRQTSLTHQSGTGPETYYTLSYDTSATLDNSCPQPANTGGRLLNRTDSFGQTWYQYDSWGRVTEEIRLRSLDAGVPCAGANPNTVPHTSYQYSANGDLTQIVYPYGRTVKYGYGTSGGALTDRVSSVTVQAYNGTTWGDQNVISAVAWEPYGGLRGYQINHPDGGTTAVEYALGDNGSVASASCPTTFPSNSLSDHTGRMRGVWVSNGAFNAGVGNGSIYTRQYAWQGDQVAETDSCLLGATTPRTEIFVYDQMLRLVDAGSPNFATTGGAFQTRKYAYDGRGNRTSQANEDFSYPLTYGASPLLDQITSQKTSGSGFIAGRTYTYSYNGDALFKNWPNDSSGNPAQQQTLHHGGYGNNSQGGLQSSLKTLTFANGGAAQYSYNYWYDAFYRRRQKTYPAGPTDEYFHDVGNQLLVDQGNNSTTAPTAYPDDNYVWLGGRPVVLVHGQLNTTTWTRQSDWTANCTRNGDTSTTTPCQFYFPITDHIGKPVVMLDSTQRVVGTADYDPFGRVNYVTLDAETKHPPLLGSGTVTLADFKQPLGVTNPSTQVSERVYLGLVDMQSGTGAATWQMKDGDTGTALTTAQNQGLRAGSLWSAWVQPSAGRVQLVYKYCSGATCTGGTGLVMEGYEYRRWQSTAGLQWFWTPLGFPGQYYDSESNLMGNWNRTYDSQIGRYLESEPILQGPYSAAKAATEGRSTPAYAYALNNPLHYADHTGRIAGADDAAAAVGAAVGVAIGEALFYTGLIGAGYCIGTHCLGSWDDLMGNHPSSGGSQMKAPGIPTEKDGFTPPKRWDGKLKSCGSGKNNVYGYPAKDGSIWVPTGEGSHVHGGPHWDVNHPDGSHTNILPGGAER